MEHCLTPAIAKAARALLEWQQADLAKAAHLSLTAINNFERKVGVTRTSTLIAIQAAFEEHGIEFLPGGGLRRSEDIATVMRFSGADFIAKWSEDIYGSVRKAGESIMTSSTNEALWYQPAFLAINNRYLELAERLQLDLKSLVPDSQKQLHRSRRNYRSVPAEMIGKITYCIYADRLAFVLWKKKQVIVLRNSNVADTFRNQFTYLWKIGKPA